MLTLTTILGHSSEMLLAERLHQVSHSGHVEFLLLDRNDTPRRRLRGVTDRGTDVAIALDRDEKLSDGAVILLEPDRAIVVRMSEQSWIKIVPRDSDCALEVGYFIGNLHWRVHFEPGAILIALEGPENHYTNRLAHLASEGKIRVVIDG